MRGRQRAWCAVAVVLAGCGGGSASSLTSVSDDGGSAEAGGQAGDGATDGGLSPRPPPALPVFDQAQVHQIELTMAPDDWQSIIDDSRGDQWRHASVSYDGVVIDNVGVRPSGESSRFAGNQKMAVRIDFEAFAGGGPFGGLREINVKGEFDDDSMMRERLALFVFDALQPTSKVCHGRLVVNGALRGLYTIRQVWDAQSAAEHFPAPLGPLYRVRATGTTDPYKYLGPATSLYVPLPWEPHIDKPARGDEVIPPFLQVLADAPATIEQVADMEDLLAYLAANALVMNTDGMVGDSSIADHFQYFDPSSQKFFVLPWDPDNTFGSQGETPDRSIYRRFDATTLALTVRDVGDFRARYKAKIAAAMVAVPLATLQAQADLIHAQIQQAAYEDPFKAFPNASFDWSLGYVKDFAAKRYANLQTQLATGP
jgi:CotH kinase protein